MHLPALALSFLDARPCLGSYAKLSLRFVQTEHVSISAADPCYSCSPRNPEIREPQAEEDSGLFLRTPLPGVQKSAA